MKETDEDENRFKEEKEKEKEGKDNIELIKGGSSRLVINKNNEKVDSFEILSKENEFDDYGFMDLSFKTIYENDPLLKHVLSHTNEYLEKNSNKSDIKIIECLTNFILQDEFTEEIINEILYNGIPESLPCIRPLIWKSLIGFYPLKDLTKWKNQSIKKNSEYKKIIEKYNYYPNNLTKERDENLIEQINKDLPRTRFDVPFFEDKNQNNDKENNYDVLRRILFYYANEHGEVGYVQGMNEIIAIIFYIFSKDDNPFNKEYTESDAYFTFEALLEQIKDIFQMENINYSQLFVTLQIKEIKKILRKIEPELLKYFTEICLELDNFVMRWILVLFAQEFTIDVAVNFWDRLFTQKNKLKFICYISSAIIKINKEKIMKMDGGEVMEWAQQLQNKMNEMDINNLVKVALEIKYRYDRKDSNNISVK